MVKMGGSRIKNGGCHLSNQRMHHRFVFVGFFLLVSNHCASCLSNSGTRFHQHRSIATTSTVDRPHQSMNGAWILQSRQKNFGFHQPIRPNQHTKAANGMPKSSSTLLQVSLQNGIAVSTIGTAFPTVDLGLVYGALLAIQFALQPILIKKFVPQGKIIRSTYVFAESLTQFIIATSFILISLSTQSGTFFALAQNIRAVDVNTFLWRSFQLAGIPAGLSVLQNFCKLLGYQKLQPITFNALNQTKTIFAAIFCYLMFNQKQSALQIVSLGLLMMSALVMESVIKVPFSFRKNNDKAFPAACVRVAPSTTSSVPRTSTSMAATRAATFAEGRAKKRNIIQSTFQTITSSSSIGFLAVLAASVMSGFGGALSQKALHSVGTMVFTAQLSFFSMVYLIISLSTGISSTDRDKIHTQGVLSGWTPYTMIPICSSAVGGILVGMVTKHAGVVRKGFALIAGLFLSGLIQNILASSSSSNGEIRSVTSQQWAGGVLAAISIWMHSAFVCI